MIVDTFVAEVRGVLNDSTDPAKNASPTYSDADIVLRGTLQFQQLTRVQIEKTRGFHNLTIVPPKAAARQLYQECWQWTLPTWISSVVRVGERMASSSQESTISPYTWVAAALPVTVTKWLSKWRPDGRLGYTWDGTRTLRVYGYSQAPDIVLDVAKLPAPLIKATIANANAAANRVWIPDTPTLGRVDIEEAIFANAELQVTTAAAAANYGAVRRVVYSSSTDVSAGPRRNLLYIENDFPAALSQNDVVQSVCPLGDEHSRVAILLTAHAMFTREGNLVGHKAIAEELRMQLAEFSRFADKKDYDGSEFWRPRTPNDSTRVTDRASSFGGGFV